MVHFNSILYRTWPHRYFSIIPYPIFFIFLNTIFLKDCFILDTGSINGIFVWIGKASSKEERVQAMKSAEGFLTKNGLPKWTKVERIVEHGETAMFKQFFSSWKEPEDSPFIGLGRVYPLETIAEWDVGSLHSDNRRRLAKSGGAAIGFMPDDSKGQKEIFRIEDFEMVPVDESMIGMFFGGDSYVLKYSYENKEGRPAYIVYFWQGQQSSQDEKAASAINAVKVDGELSGKAIQVRVVQGCEPRHFIKMFGGKMVVFMGGKASGFNNVHDHDTYDQDGTRMFRVRGTSSEDVRATQVPEVAASLNSEDVFILETPSKTWIWVGQAATEDELEIANGLVSVVSPDRENEVVREGEEVEEFWAGIGGQGDYSKCAVDFDKPILEPRLFHCKEMSSGVLKAIEINNFDQSVLLTTYIPVILKCAIGANEAQMLLKSANAFVLGY
jgi:gelsolin